MYQTFPFSTIRFWRFLEGMCFDRVQQHITQLLNIHLLRKICQYTKNRYKMKQKVSVLSIIFTIFSPQIRSLLAKSES